MQYWIGVATITGIYLLATMGISILTGFTGLFSMGHAGFMAIGAYASAIVVKSFNVPIGVGLVAGMLGAVLVGIVIGLPTLRLSGDYFVIATLGFGEVAKLAIENLDITGGARGLTGVAGGVNFPLVLILNVVVIIALRNFLTSRHGRNCIAIREEELAAKTIGVDVNFYKIVALAISCALAGLSGALMAHYMRYLHPSMFNSLKSNELIMTVILGGRGSLTGTIIATCLLMPLPELLRMGTAQEWRMVIYGVLVILVILNRPSGLMGNKEFSIKRIIDFFKTRLAAKPKKERE